MSEGKAPSSNDPQAWIAWVHSAMAEKQWATAEARRQHCIETFGDRVPHGWLAELIRAAIETCRFAPDREQRRIALINDVRDRVAPNDPRVGLQLLLSLGAVEDAAALLSRTERSARSARDLETCFAFIPRLVEQGSRGALWERLLGRAGEAGARELELRLLLALGRFAEFVRLFDASPLGDTPHAAQLGRVRTRLGKPRGAVFAEPKVFGIGLSRTGTTSLNEALVLLGIDAAHWTNPLTGELIAERDLFLLGGATDCSVAQDFEKLYYLYPNARFVWTTRRFDDWQKSFLAHHARHSWADDPQALRRVFDAPRCVHGLSHAAIEFGLYLNAEDLGEAFGVFETRVRQFFANKPDGRLLELDLFAGQGWAELCGFLGLAVPPVPFPKSNAAP